MAWNESLRAKFLVLYSCSTNQNGRVARFLFKQWLAADLGRGLNDGEVDEFAQLMQ